MEETMKKVIVAILVSVVLMSLPVFAAGTKESADQKSGPMSWIEDGGVAGLPGVNPLKVSGNIITAGSSTVYPLSERMAERFKQEGYSGVITIDSIGILPDCQAATPRSMFLVTDTAPMGCDTLICGERIMSS